MTTEQLFFISSEKLDILKMILKEGYGQNKLNFQFMNFLIVVKRREVNQNLKVKIYIYFNFQLAKSLQSGYHSQNFTMPACHLIFASICGKHNSRLSHNKLSHCDTGTFCGLSSLPETAGKPTKKACTSLSWGTVPFAQSWGRQKSVWLAASMARQATLQCTEPKV